MNTTYELEKTTLNPIQNTDSVRERRHSADQLLSIANDGEAWKRFYVSLWICHMIMNYIIFFYTYLLVWLSISYPFCLFNDSFYCFLVDCLFSLQGCEDKKPKPVLYHKKLSSLHNSQEEKMSPGRENIYSKEKEKWKEIYGSNAPTTTLFNKSKSEGFIDLNATQTVNLTLLSIKRRPKGKLTGSNSKHSKAQAHTKLTNQLYLPAIDEKHNTYHSSKSPVILQRKSKSRFKQVQLQGGHRAHSLFDNFIGE